MSNITHIISIDPGSNTGFAILDVKTRELSSLCTTNAPTAQAYIEAFTANVKGVLIVVEDARLRSGFKNQYAAKMAAVIKNNCKLWEQWLKLKGINYEMVAPRKANPTKHNPALFATYTGYKGRTSEHSRDAGMLAFTFNLAIWESKRSLK